MHSDFTRFLRGWLVRLGMLLLILLLVALGEWLPLMPAVQRFQQANPGINRSLTAVAVCMTGLGTLLLAFTQFLVRVPDPRRPAQAQASRTKGLVKGKGWLFSGLSLSAGFSDQARFWRVRKAFRDGEWWRVPRWRRLTLMLLGAIMLFYGLFGLIFLLSPPGVKFIVLLTVCYGTFRSAYAFAVDRPFRQDGDGSG